MINCFKYVIICILILFRKWNFIEVNVTKKELHDELSNHIKHLIYPLNTVLDESIGCAFWFASRGIGVNNGNSWKSFARVCIKILYMYKIYISNLDLIMIVTNGKYNV